MNRQRFIHCITVGALVLAAIGTCLAKAAPAPARAAASPAAQVFAALDTDHDHAVSAREFEAGYAGLQRAIALGLRLREQFDTVDADHSRALDGKEFASMVLVRQAGRAAPMLASFDANGNGTLDFPEYAMAVRKLATPAAAPAKAGG